MKSSSKEQSDFVKFALSGKESFILFLKVCQSVESVALLRSLNIELHDGTSFSTSLSMPFSYFFYVIGRYVKSLDVVDFPKKIQSLFKGLLDNEGLAEIHFSRAFKNPTWVKVLESVKTISGDLKLFEVLSSYNTDFSFDFITVTTMMNYSKFSHFLRLRNLKSKELTIVLCPCNYEGSLFRQVQKWSALAKINLIIHLNLEDAVKSLDIINNISCIFPNLQSCYLLNVNNDNFLGADCIKKSISKAKSNFSSYAGKIKVDIRWSISTQVYRYWDDVFLKEFSAKMQDFLPHYMYDKDRKGHEWIEKVSLTPKLSFESVITITEIELKEIKLDELFKNESMSEDDEEFNYEDENDDIDEYEDDDIDNYEDDNYDSDF